MPNGGSATPRAVGWRIQSATIGVLALIAVPLGSEAAEPWRWPANALVSCEAAEPDRVMDVYMAPDRTSAGRHILRRCRAGTAETPDRIVTIQLRFTKRAALVAALDVTVDHAVLDGTATAILPVRLPMPGAMGPAEILSRVNAVST